MTDAATTVGDRYVLGGLLGRGGMASVHRAVDSRLGRPVAVKRLSLALAADRTAQLRFQREAHAAASLNHPNIAAVFDTGSDVDPASGVDVPYLVMELVEGKTLRDLLRDGAPPGPERSVEIVSQVLAALATSHAAGLVHRDIKPANIMITPAGAVKVMDFGIARAADDSTAGLTGPAAVIGTAQYLSPEQARGEAVDARSDLYSTGCVLHELLLGRPVFTGESSVSLAYQHVNEDPAPLRASDPGLGPELETVVLRALAKDPAQRYPSATAMRADLDRLLRTGRVRADPAALGAAVAASTTARAAAPPAAPPHDPTTALLRTDPAGSAAAGVPLVAGAAAPLPPADPPEPPRRRRGTVVLLALLVVGLLVAVVALGLPALLGGGTAARSVTVPDVRGQTRADADATLRNADLVPRFTNVKGPDDESVDRVVGEDPGGGASVASGSDVAVQVNVGPDSARIPAGLVGRDDDDARERLDKAGFSDVVVQRAAARPSGAKTGQVLAVDPGEGALTPLDARVVLTVAPSGAAPATTRAPAPASSSAPAPSRAPASSAAPSEPTPSPSAPSSSAAPSASSSATPSSTPTDQGGGNGNGNGNGNGGGNGRGKGKGEDSGVLAEDTAGA